MPSPQIEMYPFEDNGPGPFGPKNLSAYTIRPALTFPPFARGLEPWWLIEGGEGCLTSNALSATPEQPFHCAQGLGHLGVA